MTALMYRLDDAAAQTGVAKRRIEVAIANSEITARYPDSHPRIEHGELTRWIASLPTEKPRKTDRA